MKSLHLEDIRALNIEVSSGCIGNCPFCSRRQKVRPYLEHRITFPEFRLLPVGLLRQLKRIVFAGNFGDLCSNRDFLKIAEYVKQINETVTMGGDTNGSLQDEAWWQALGPFFRDGVMVFSLDGLEDTHRIHRRGTRFPAIIRNIRAFTSSGGVAHWKFIAFEHNEHQIEAAEAMAREIGCARFFVISSRDYDETCRPPRTLDIQIKRDVFQAYWERRPNDEKTAQCKPWHKGSIYIAADGTVHPCCFAHCMYITEHNSRFRFIVPLIEKYRNEINFKTRPLAQILSGPYFSEVISAAEKNSYCSLKCNPSKKRIRQEIVLRDTFFHLS